MDAEELGAETEEGSAGGRGEFLSVGEGEGLAAALDDFLVVGVGYVEGIAGEGPEGGVS